MQIFSKRGDIFKNQRDAGQSSKKWNSPAKIGTCGHLNLVYSTYFKSMFRFNKSKIPSQFPVGQL